SLSASSPSPANVGSSETTTITTGELNGFTGTISFADNPPSGLNCQAFSPPTVAGSGTSTLSCTSTSAGTYSVTVTGNSGSLHHASTVTFRFNAISSPDFVIVGTPTTLTI